jgi:hypothetical protein
MNFLEPRPITITLLRQTIELGDASALLEVFGRHESSRAHWEQGAQQYALQVSGYDNDPRELPQIPEVVDFFRAWDNVCLTWDYFLDDSTPRHAWLYACLFGEASLLDDGTLYWSIDAERFGEWTRAHYLAIALQMDRLGFQYSEVDATLQRIAQQHRQLFVVEN